MCQGGSDTQSLLPTVLQHLNSPDPVCKKLALWLVSNHASHADLLLAVNSLTKDCQAASPLTRGLALRTLTQLEHSDFIEYSLQAVLRGLQDSSSYVRRVAVMGCAKLHKFQPRLVEDRGVIDILYGMIRDSDPIVVMNCLHSLQEILKNEGGVVINRNINNFLLNRIGEFPIFHRAPLFRFLSRYKPKSEDDIFDIMNICDEHLSSDSATTVVEVVGYFTTLTENLPKVKHQVLNRAKEPLVHFLASGNPELVFIMLGVLEKYYIPDGLDQLQSVYVSLLCKQKEPSYVKKKRIDILCRLISEETMTPVLEDLYMCATSHDTDLSKSAITAVEKVAVKGGTFLSESTNMLLKLLSMNREDVTLNVLHAFSSLDLQYVEETVIEKVLSQTCKCLLNESHGCLTSLLWLLGEYGERFDSTCYAFEEYLNTFESWHDTELCLSIISTAVKLLLKQPVQYQFIVGSLFERAHSKGDFLIKQTVSHYYGLLQSDVDATRQIVLGN